MTTQPRDRKSPPPRPPSRYAQRRSERLSGDSNHPSTIDYTCKRCGFTRASHPLPTHPQALPVYALPTGWQLGSALAHEGVIVMARQDDDYCLCLACVGNVRSGFPLDMADLGRSKP